VSCVASRTYVCTRDFDFVRYVDAYMRFVLRRDRRVLFRTFYCGRCDKTLFGRRECENSEKPTNTDALVKIDYYRQRCNTLTRNGDIIDIPIRVRVSSYLRFGTSKYVFDDIRAARTGVTRIRCVYKPKLIPGRMTVTDNEVHVTFLVDVRG